MVRPLNCRQIACRPGSQYFKPGGVSRSSLEEVVLSMDEFEAIRLADLEMLYQEKAAGRMKISRQTFGRIVESAHRKVAEALVAGKALKIEGGKISMAGAKPVRIFVCCDCRHSWELPYGTGRPDSCPACKGQDIHRAGISGRAPEQARGMCRRIIKAKN